MVSTDIILLGVVVGAIQLGAIWIVVQLAAPGGRRSR